MTPVEAVNKSYSNIVAKNAELICSGYVPTEELYVILEGPRASNRGHENIFKGWRDFCDSPISLDGIDWIEGPYSEQEGNMAWVGGITTLHVNFNGNKFDRTFRCTFVLTKYDDSDWLIKHEHVSAPMEDPYGIGDWLKKD